MCSMTLGLMRSRHQISPRWLEVMYSMLSSLYSEGQSIWETYMVSVEMIMVSGLPHSRSNNHFQSQLRHKLTVCAHS